MYPNAPGGDSCWALGWSFPSYSCPLISEHDLHGARGPAHTGVEIQRGAHWGCLGGPGDMWQALEEGGDKGLQVGV